MNVILTEAATRKAAQIKTASETRNQRGSTAANPKRNAIANE